jgi:hypothetical protein
VAVAAHPVDAYQIAAADIADVDRVAEVEKHGRERRVVAPWPAVAVEHLLASGELRRRHVRVGLEVEAVVQHVVIDWQRKRARAIVDHGHVRCRVVGGAARVEHHTDARRCERRAGGLVVRARLVPIRDLLEHAAAIAAAVRIPGGLPDLDHPLEAARWNRRFRIEIVSNAHIKKSPPVRQNHLWMDGRSAHADKIAQ